MFEEIKKLKELVVLWLAVFVVTACFFFFFGLNQVNVFGASINVPVISSNSFSVQFFKMMQADLLPSEVTLVAMSPMSALNTQAAMAFLLSFLFTFPFLMYELVKYLAPALYEEERRSFLMALIPAIVLFFSGTFFAYKYVIPPTFRALYFYTLTSGATALFSLDAFATTAIMFMMVVGVLFLLPIGMVLLSFLGIIPASFWRKNWRYAILTFVIFSAIITPDGSGVSMVLLALPLGGLYAAGVGVASLRPAE